MGRIAPEKSITVIIDALKKVVAINDNIRFLIVGGGPQLEELKEYVKNDHIESYVIFTGPQSGEMVPAHYHISNMFISASLSETQGLTYIEAMASSIPVINAGDGGHQHPTQTLTDLLTIRSLKGRLDNLTIGLCGDLKFGRTVHSLIEALVLRYSNVKFVLISPEELRVPSYIREDILEKHNVEFEEVERLEDALPKLDVLYMTRVQRERFTDLEEYERVKNVYILRNDMLRNSRENLRILHPLPRVNEIAYDVDDNPKAYYIQQARNGLFARQAIICEVLGISIDE